MKDSSANTDYCNFQCLYKRSAQCLTSKDIKSYWVKVHAFDSNVNATDIYQGNRSFAFIGWEDIFLRVQRLHISKDSGNPESRNPEIQNLEYRNPCAALF